MFEFTIVAAFTNLTADTVVLHPCGWQGPAVVLEKWVDGKWRRAVDRVCADVRVSNAPRLAPGESRTDTARLSASFGPNREPRFEVSSVPGWYRLVYARAHRYLHPGRDVGELLPKELRVSSPFRIVE